MWPVFGILIAVNVLSVVVLALIALSVGSGSAPAEYPTAENREVRLGRFDPTRSGDIQSMGPRAEIPPEYRAVEPAPSPWVVLPDGSVRFSKSD